MRHSLRQPQQPLNFIVIDRPEPLAIQNRQVAQPDQNNEGRAPITVGQAVQLLRKISLGIELNAKIIGRHRSLGSHRIAPSFDMIMTILQHSPTRTDTELTTPHMCELMKKREYLPALSIASIDEDERRNRGLQGESSELIEVEHTMTVVLDHGINDHQAAETLEGVDEMIPDLIKGSHPTAGFNLIIQRPTNIRRSSLSRGTTSRADECQRLSIAERIQIVFIPSLTTLIEINRLKKIIRRLPTTTSTSTEIGNRELLMRRLG